MAFNPFLSMGEPAPAPTCADVLNPFMMTDAEPAAFGADNPFATSNPFSDFGGGFEPVAGDTVPVDMFGAPDPPGGGARLFDAPAPPGADLFASPPPAPLKPTELELPPARPLPPETQNLILSVTGHMEFASSHLLDRIPPTRTPSPVSARDMHSPSPTPEPDPLDEPAPPCAPAPAPAPAPADSFDINRNKPARPRPPAPPARPPASPAARAPPPRPAPPPQPPAPADDINLFDAPVPTMVKPTKEAILSLYSAPKKEEERQIDFLSDDIVADTHTEPPPVGAPSPGGASTPARASSPKDSSAPMDCSEPPPAPAAPGASSPFAEHVEDNFPPPDAESNPFDSMGVDDAAAYADSSDIFGVGTSDRFDAASAAGDGSGAPPGPREAEDVFHAPPAAEPDWNAPAAAEPDWNAPAAAEPDWNAPAAAEPDWNAPAAAEPDWNAPAAAEPEWNAPAAAEPEWNAPAAAEPDWGAPLPADPGWGAPPAPEAMLQDPFPESQDAFDAFSAKFDSTTANHMSSGAWGAGEGGRTGAGGGGAGGGGFEAEAFDPFLSMSAPPPPPAPAATPRLRSQGSRDSADDTFSVFIRPKESGAGGEEAVPALAPPPRAPPPPDSPRANPFDKSGDSEAPAPPRQEAGTPGTPGTPGAPDTPDTPLFDEDVSMPLEEFPRTRYAGPGWEMHLRQPNKKKITGQRFWKKIFVRMAYQGDNPVVQLLNSAGDKEPFQELPLQACYSVSEVGAQQFDQFGKIFTVKLQYVFYKERPGVRPGQVTKAERITNKLSQFAAYAIQGDYQGVKEFGSDLRKLGLPVEHAPQVSQLFKLGSLAYEDVKQFSCCIEEALFRLPAHRDRALTYKMEEVQITAVDELYVEQDAEGSVLKQIARVRLFFLGFLSGMPDVELGVNDLRRQGKEVVGRHDIIPVVTEEWIRVEDTEYHACVQPDEFHSTQIIKFKPPDACYIELMRFRVRPPKNRELPLQLKAAWCVNGNKVELRADVLVPGFASRKLGQVPCEDVAVRFPIPECWIYLFRVEKHFRYGSVKSAHRRTGKIKGIERFLGAVDTLSESLIEVTSGQAKYEHPHRAIVWRMPRLPKEGQGAYTTHNLVCRMALTSYDQVPAELARWAHVEFTMPATQVSHVTVRSVSLQHYDADPPEKYVRYLARHEYIVGIERTSGQAAPAYAAAAASAEPRAPAPAAAAPPAPAAAPPAPAAPSSDSDSD